MVLGVSVNSIMVDVYGRGLEIIRFLFTFLKYIIGVRKWVYIIDLR